MRDLTKEFKHRTIQYEKLIEYGFIKEKDQYSYKTKILDGKFEVHIFVQNESILSCVYDVENECEYALVNVIQATGEFVGKVKKSYEECLNEVLEQCTTYTIFQKPQSQEIIEYVHEKYQDELEFLWENSLSAIWRNKMNQKWYGLIFSISKRKLGINSDEMTEAINLRWMKDQVSDIIDYQRVFPAYHMNKKSWITIPLDGILDNQTIFSWIDSSYQFSLRK